MAAAAAATDLIRMTMLLIQKNSLVVVCGRIFFLHGHKKNFFVISIIQKLGDADDLDLIQRVVGV